MPDLWLYGILNFLNKGRCSSNFRKIRAMVLKLHTNILYRSKNFGNEFGQNRLKRSHFFRFWIFWEFSQNYLTQVNFDLSSWNFVHKITNTDWCLILNFVKISRELKILDEFEFFLFLFILTSNFKNLMYPRSFLCKKAKIKQRTFSKKELCEIGEEAIWESRFTSFFIFYLFRFDSYIYIVIYYILYSFFFEKVCCLILASSQWKLCGYIKFKNFYVTIKKEKKIKIRFKFKGFNRFSFNI